MQVKLQNYFTSEIFPTYSLPSKLWGCVQSCNNLHTAYSYLPQANTARVIFSWNDVDPTMPDGSDAMRHTTRSSASLNLLGGLPDPPPEPSDTRSFTFRVNNVCISSVNQRLIYMRIHTTFIRVLFGSNFPSFDKAGVLIFIL